MILAFQSTQLIKYDLQYGSCLQSHTHQDHQHSSVGSPASSQWCPLMVECPQCSNWESSCSSVLRPDSLVFPLTRCTAMQCNASRVSDSAAVPISCPLNGGALPQGYSSDSVEFPLYSCLCHLPSVLFFQQCTLCIHSAWEFKPSEPRTF